MQVDLYTSNLTKIMVREFEGFATLRLYDTENDRSNFTLFMESYEVGIKLANLIQEDAKLTKPESTEVSIELIPLEKSVEETGFTYGSAEI